MADANITYFSYRNYPGFFVGDNLVSNVCVIIPSFIWPPCIYFSVHHSYFVNCYRVFKNQTIITTLVVSMLIPVKIMFFGSCLTLLRQRRRIDSLLRSLFEKNIFACYQFVNPSPQVGIIDGIIFSRFLLLFKAVLGDSASSILARMYWSSQNL